MKFSKLIFNLAAWHKLLDLRSRFITTKSLRSKGGNGFDFFIRVQRQRNSAQAARSFGKAWISRSKRLKTLLIVGLQTGIPCPLSALSILLLSQVSHLSTGVRSRSCAPLHRLPVIAGLTVNGCGFLRLHSSCAYTSICFQRFQRHGSAGIWVLKVAVFFRDYMTDTSESLGILGTLPSVKAAERGNAKSPDAIRYTAVQIHCAIAEAQLEASPPPVCCTNV